MDRAKPGHTVIFQGLKGAAHLNGTEGRLIKYIKKEGRWSVRCNNSNDNNGTLVNAKRENLKLHHMHLSPKDAEEMAEEQEQHTHVEQVAAPAQLPGAQQLRRIALPRVLVTVKADQAAQPE